jgi:hypothetical protein
VGLTGTCGAALDDERHFQLAVTGGGFRTDLTFQGTHQHLEEASAALALTYRRPPSPSRCRPERCSPEA